MTNREKVIADLEFSYSTTLSGYAMGNYGADIHGITSEILRDALALLKAQEPRLLTLDEIHDSMVVYLEAGTKLIKRMDDDGVVLAIGGSDRAGAKCFITVWDIGIAAMNDEYNVTWRAWSKRPTKEQREREPWDRRVKDDQR